MKKRKQPGENISLKTKKNESPAVMEWINSQTNLMDSIRYLIENEIGQHGVRNLQLIIPAERGPVAAPALMRAMEEVAAAAEPPAAIREAPQEDEIDEEDIESWI